MRKLYIILLLCSINAYTTKAQTYSNTTVTNIPDFNFFGVYSDIVVSGVAPTAILEKVEININHPFVSDLAIYLVDPLNNEHALSLNNGGGGDNYVGTVFIMSATVSISSATAPFTGNFLPESPLPKIINPNGTWRLRVIDMFGGDVGTIQNWHITFIPPQCAVIGFNDGSPTLPSVINCTDTLFLAANDSATANGYIFPSLFFQFRTGALGSLYNSVIVYEDGNIIYQRAIGQMQNNTVLTVYAPAPFFSPSSNYSIRVCNTAGLAPMNWNIFDANGYTHASGTTPAGCTNYGSWSPHGLSTWTITPVGTSGFISTDYGLSGFWPEFPGPGTYEITYNWDNQGIGVYHCTGSASHSLEVVSPWSANWTNPGVVCETDPNISLNTLITGDAGGQWTGSNVAGGIFIPAGNAGEHIVTYTVGNTAACFATHTDTIRVIAVPTAIAGSNTSICAGDSLQISGASIGGSATGCIWTTSGTGTFNDASIVNAIYKPSAQDIANGSVVLTINTVGPCVSVSSNFTLTINAVDNASFSYSSGTFCITGTNPVPTGIITTGGTFSANPAGLSINSTNGTIDLPLSNEGSYLVTYTTTGICPDTSTVSVSLLPGFDAEFYYISPICEDDASNAFPLHNTGTNGVYSASPAGLAFENISTGEINVIASQHGTYIITNTIEASGGCGAATYIDTLVINEAAAVSLLNLTDSICSGTSYQISGTTIGGSASSVSWSTNGTGNFTNNNIFNPIYNPSSADITAGTVILTATTDNPIGPCGTKSASMTLRILPLPIIDTIYVTNLTCNNSNNGQFIIVGTGLTDYSINGGINFQLSNAFSGLSAGNYDIVVVDVYGCILNTTALISEPSVFTVTETINHYNCGVLGSISLNVTGATPNYSYNWSNGGNTSSIIDLMPNNYSVTISDNNNCTYTNTYTVNTLGGVGIAEVDVQNNVNCYGESTGKVIVSMQNGMSPFNYSWSHNPSLNNQTADGLSAGTYIVTITDATSCTAELSISITQPETPLSLIFNPQDVSCYNFSDGVVSANAQGGTSPYYYNWENGSDSSVISNLSIGTYELTVTDENGCTFNDEVIIGQPEELSISFTSIQAPLCYNGNDGGLSVNVSGGTGSYNYEWSDGSVNQNLNGVGAGLYQLTVTDSNGCSYSSQVAISQPEELVLSIVDIQIPLCFNGNDGQVEVTATGGVAPYSYSIAPGNSSNFNMLSAGEYFITVSDNHSCTAVITAVVNNPLPINISHVINIDNYLGEIALTVSGGNDPYFYEWSNGQVTSNANQLLGGTYSVTVTDINGCTETLTVKVNIPLIIPNVITPNNDGYNDDFNIINIDAYERVSVEIFGRWGDKLFFFEGPGIEYYDPSKRWNGTFNGNNLPMGSYIYIINIYDTEETFNGAVLIKR